ncbi:hypothetical protein CEP53_001129 [Fusarium sp. AF-6]|nr:hypothetical protein CEP53_001129 [Fusarium sp. AF-6]
MSVKPDILMIDSTVQAVDVARRHALGEKFNFIYYDCESTNEFKERMKPGGPYANIVAIVRNGWHKAGPLAYQRPFATDVVPHYPESLKSEHGCNSARMIKHLDQAAEKHVKLLVFPDLTFNTFFASYVIDDPEELAKFFEPASPADPYAIINSPNDKPLIDRANDLGIDLYLGYGERWVDDDGKKTYYNTAVYYSASQQKCIAKYRKGVEILLEGYNTTAFAPQYEGTSEWQEEEALFHHRLSCQAGSYQNACFSIHAAKAGKGDHGSLIGGSSIVDPNGHIIAESKTKEDELVYATIDLAKCRKGKGRVFAFEQHRRTEHYSRLINQTGVEEPPLLDE